MILFLNILKNKKKNNDKIITGRLINDLIKWREIYIKESINKLKSLNRSKLFTTGSRKKPEFLIIIFT